MSRSLAAHSTHRNYVHSYLSKHISGKLGDDAKLSGGCELPVLTQQLLPYLRCTAAYILDYENYH